MPREVNERSKVSSGNFRSVESISETWIVWFADQAGLAARASRFEVVKVGLRSMADMWQCGCWEVIEGVVRRVVVRVRGPLALSRILRGVLGVGGGRWGVMREMSWVAKRMLQPPVRSL